MKHSRSYKILTFLETSSKFHVESDVSFTLEECLEILEKVHEATYKFSKWTEVTISSSCIVFTDLHGNMLDESKFVCFKVLQRCPETHSAFLKLSSVDINTRFDLCIGDCLPTVLEVLLSLKEKNEYEKKDHQTFHVRDLHHLNSKRLCQLFRKVTGDWNNHTARLMHQSDVEILETVTTSFENRRELDSTDEHRLSCRLQDFSELMSEEAIINMESFLDFGGGHGDFAHRIKEVYKNVKTSVSLDLKTWYSKEHTAKHKDVEYVFVNTITLPFASDSFDVISILQVIHHLDEQRETLKELYRISRGVLFIREHDCQTPEDKVCIDLEHMIHEVSFRKNKSICCTYQAQYLSKQDLYEMLRDVGFVLIKDTVPKSVTNCYYSAWKKIK